MASVYEDILRAAEAACKALSLPGVGSNVLVRKLPAVEEELDTLPLLAIVPSEEDEEIKRASFEGDKFVTRKFDAALISKGKYLLAAEGNADPNDDLYRQVGWREPIINRCFNPQTFAAVGRVKGTTVKPGRPVDRRKVNQNYSYSIVTVEVRTQEP